MKYLISGDAALIGAMLVSRSIQNGDEVIEIDGFIGYYSPGLMMVRVEKLISPFGSWV